MALTRYRWTADLTHESGNDAEGSGQVDAENPRDAEAMVVGFVKGKGCTATSITLTPTD
ncbi:MULTISPECIES: hypothetical protein [unclassified Streptomyces]|uniref:hypothetical protein n=1 Tax=unclassified Streptomyces TaxID=2593676 RepID=UPI00382E27E0